MTSRSMGALKRTSVLAVGAGVVVSLAFAGPALAAPPTAGANCQSDGRIHAGGATFANNVQRLVFEPAYRREVCGPIAGGPVDANNEPNSSDRMVLYNYVGRPTGSGSGINGAYCRVDAFEGTDVPYTIAQLGLLRGAVPAPAASECAPFQSVATPFQPTPAPFPAPTDTASNMMSFPIAGGAVAIGYNLTAAACGGSTPPASIQLNSLQASRLFGGQILNWNDADLVAIQPAGSTLANCTVAVSRFARSDNSGTTTIFKSYLNKADGARALCDGTTWSTRTGQNGNNFPAGAGCSAVTYASGNPGVINGTGGTVGGVGYGDLAEWRTLQPTLGLATVRNATNDAYVSPLSGLGSNCTFAGATLPPGGTNGAVGLAGNAWGQRRRPEPRGRDVHRHRLPDLRPDVRAGPSRPERRVGRSGLASVRQPAPDAVLVHVQHAAADDPGAARVELLRAGARGLPGHDPQRLRRELLSRDAEDRRSPSGGRRPGPFDGQFRPTTTFTKGFAT